jgi:DNA-binding PadR family transcriptional regulator
MPRARYGPSVAYYALLGLVRLRPGHGYDLVRRLRESAGLSQVVPLNPPTVYQLLHDLEADGLIEGQPEPDTYPPRTRFRVTQAGADALARWLEAPVARLREVRRDLLLKLYFARRLSPDRGASLLRRQIAELERYVGNANAERDELTLDSFDHLVLDSKVTAAKSTLRWLDRYRATLQQETVS